MEANVIVERVERCSHRNRKEHHGGGRNTGKNGAARQSHPEVDGDRATKLLRRVQPARTVDKTEIIWCLTPSQRTDIAPRAADPHHFRIEKNVERLTTTRPSERWAEAVHAQRLDRTRPAVDDSAIYRPAGGSDTSGYDRRRAEFDYRRIISEVAREFSVTKARVDVRNVDVFREKIAYGHRSQEDVTW